MGAEQGARPAPRHHPARVHHGARAHAGRRANQPQRWLYEGAARRARSYCTLCVCVCDLRTSGHLGGAGSPATGRIRCVSRQSRRWGLKAAGCARHAAAALARATPRRPSSRLPRARSHPARGSSPTSARCASFGCPPQGRSLPKPHSTSRMRLVPAARVLGGHFAGGCGARAGGHHGLGVRALHCGQQRGTGRQGRLRRAPGVRARCALPARSSAVGRLATP